MNLDFLTNNQGFVEAIRLFALVITLLHLLWGLVIFRQFLSASRMITTRMVGTLKLLIFVHILFLAVILLLVVFY